VFCRIRAVKAGLDIPTCAIEAHALAGVDASKVISAMIAAHSIPVDLIGEDATGMDLDGHDALAEVAEARQEQRQAAPSA
jgi:uncharacterized protein YqfA (UPF0365 family)